MRTMTETVIKMVWGKVSKLGNTNEVAIAGGVITDHYFGLESRDIDVFISKNTEETALEFIEEYGFEAIIAEDILEQKEDSYGEMYRTRIGSKQESGIASAWTGKLYGVTVDLVLVTHDDITEYITERFDQSIKSAWYDGEFHYTDSFMKTIETGVIEPVRHEATGYIRAWLSAQKYDLVVSPRYELSKQYTKLLQKDEELETYISKSTMSKIEGLESDMFNFKYDKANAMLMDLFLSHEKESDEVYEKLLTIINKDMVIEHPAIGEYEVAVKHNHAHDFTKSLSRAYYGLQEDFEEAAADLSPLMILTEEQFTNGKFKDASGRDVRIGRQLNKILRQHKAAFETVDISRSHFTDAIKVFETRSTSSKAKVFITGHKHALLNISTGTHWTSCQSWKRGRGGNNYGLLANVSGSTLVAYVADERSDTKQKNWQARILIRVGEDGSLFMERTYTDRSTFGREVLNIALTKSLREAGFTILEGKEETLDFRTKPMWTRPYNDMHETVVMKIASGVIMRGRRKEVEIERRKEAFNNKIGELISENKLDFYRVGLSVWTAIIELPESLRSEARYRMNEGYGFPSRFLVEPNLLTPMIQRDRREYMQYSVIEIEGVYHVAVTRSIPHYALSYAERELMEYRLAPPVAKNNNALPVITRVPRAARIAQLRAREEAHDPFAVAQPARQFQLRDGVMQLVDNEGNVVVENIDEDDVDLPF